MGKNYFVYILSNKRDTVLYIGVTSNLENRIREHKNKKVEGFTKKYNVDKLVYYEVFDDVNEALEAEKKLKNWRREWKVNLVNERNPTWSDLTILR